MAKLTDDNDDDWDKPSGRNDSTRRVTAHTALSPFNVKNVGLGISLDDRCLSLTTRTFGCVFGGLALTLLLAKQNLLLLVMWWGLTEQ